MADEPFINRKDLEDVTQKVAIQNSKDIAKPLIDQQKNNDLKELERSIEQKAIFQDIADGINNLADALLEGLKGLIPKEGSSFGQAIAVGAGALAMKILTPLKDLRNTFKALRTKIKNSKIGKSFGGFLDRFKNIFRSIFEKLKKSKLVSFFKNNKAFAAIAGVFTKAFGKGGALSKLGAFFKNSKVFTAIGGLFTKVFGKGGFFSGLSGIFGKLKGFTTSGPFKSIAKIGGKLLGLLGKVFLPVTIILGVIDFVKGFMKGNSEGGIIEGIKQGVQQLFDGLIGGILRIMSWIPENIAKLFGLNKLSKAFKDFTETIIQSIKDVFGGLVDLIKSIFTLDGAGIMKSLKDIWNGIADLVMSPFILLGEAIEDIFDIDLDEIFAPITEAFDNMGAWFSDLGTKIDDFFSMETIDKFIDKLKFWKGDGEGANATKIFNEQMRKSKPFLQDIPAGGAGGMGPRIARGGDTNVTNSAPTIINNTINAPSNNGIAAMQRAFMT